MSVAMAAEQINGICIPQADWSLERLGECCMQSARLTAKGAWLTGRAVNFAEPHFKEKGEWMQWQEKHCHPAKYSSIRRYCQLANAVKFEELPDKLMPAYALGRIKTKPAGAGKKKTSAKRHNALFPPEILSPPVKPKEDTSAVVVSPKDEDVQSSEPLEGPAMIEAVTRLAVRMGGLEKLKALVDSLLLSRSM